MAIRATRATGAAIAVAVAVALLSPDAAEAQADYLKLAKKGVARAKSVWRDRKRGWYDESLHDRDRYPLATIWGALPLFEALDGIAVAEPTTANRKAVGAFARGAERYFDKDLRPHGGFAPYPGSRGRVKTWFDDNGWWGLAFFDAFRVTASRRYLRDAKRAFLYSANAGWDRLDGGLWWNTERRYKAGESLASNTLLGTLIYVQTKQPYYLQQVEKFIRWGNSDLWNEDAGLYARSDFDQTAMPYVQGPLIEAHQLLCKATGNQSFCADAAALADRVAERFLVLSMGPQYDCIYLRSMLAYGRFSGDGRWRAFAEAEAARALANGRDSSGLYLRAWDGSDMSGHQDGSGMLRTHAATISLFAWLAATPTS